MGRLVRRYRESYGSSAFHLLLMLAAFALGCYVILTATPMAVWNPKVWWKSIAVWFAAAIIVHDFVLFPLYATADRLLAAWADKRRQAAVSVRNHLRLPAMASGLTLLVFWPGIVGQGAQTYRAATGQTQQPFLGRWLVLSAALFGLSAMVYVIRRVVAHRRFSRTEDPESHGVLPR